MAVVAASTPIARPSVVVLGCSLVLAGALWPSSACIVALMVSVGASGARLSNLLWLCLQTPCLAWPCLAQPQAPPSPSPGRPSPKLSEGPQNKSIQVVRLAKAKAKETKPTQTWIKISPLRTLERFSNLVCPPLLQTHIFLFSLISIILLFFTCFSLLPIPTRIPFLLSLSISHQETASCLCSPKPCGHPCLCQQTTTLTCILSIPILGFIFVGLILTLILTLHDTPSTSVFPQKIFDRLLRPQLPAFHTIT